MAVDLPEVVLASVDGRVVARCSGSCGDEAEEMDVYSAAYLVYRGKASFRGSSGWGAAFSLLSEAGADIDLFFVYMDLRRRGRRPQVGVRKRTLVYQHGSNRYEVLVLSEGYPVTLGSLMEWSRLSSSDGYMPVIAVVDRYGVVTYYEARAVSSIA